jgi:ribonuclease HII
VVNIPVPSKATTISGSRLNLGKDHIASKKLTPNVDKRIIIKPKKTIAPVFLLILYITCRLALINTLRLLIVNQIVNQSNCKFIHDYFVINFIMNILCGIDEAGRGPLAGPVVSAAVVLPDNHSIKGLKDSKKISPKLREELFDEIISVSDVGIGVVSSRKIDRINILQATYVSMEKALMNLKNFPNKILVDGFPLPSEKIKSEGIIKGDEKIEQISAASIIAKVARDRFMKLVDPIFPEYDFSNNKGYGTKNHINALKNKKASLIHRMTFEPVKSNLPSKSLIKNTYYNDRILNQKKQLKILNKEINNWFKLNNLIK